MGEGCVWVPWLIPLYPEMIKFHNNVHIHKTAKLIPHDIVNGFLKKARPEEDFGAFERLGCIEIMDNVYVSANVQILPDVRIGSNCIIAAGSVVSSDIPDNSVVAGNPARVIGSFDAYVAARKMIKNQSVAFKNQEIPDSVVEEQWERFYKKREKKAIIDQVSTTDQTDKDNTISPVDADSIENRTLKLLSSNFKDIDFSSEQHLIEDEVLESMEIVSIISLIDEEFGVKIPLSMIDEEHFDSVHLIATLVKDLLEKK